MRIATLSNASAIHTQRWVAHFRARGHEVGVWSLEPGPPELEARALPAPPVRWGVALTGKQCVVTLADGHVVCLGEDVETNR